MTPVKRWSVGSCLLVVALLGTMPTGEAAQRGDQPKLLQGLYAGAGSGVTSDGPGSILVVINADGAGGGTLELTRLSSDSVLIPMTYSVTPGGRITMFVNSDGHFGTLIGQIVNKGRTIAFNALIISNVGYDVSGMLEAE